MRRSDFFLFVKVILLCLVLGSVVGIAANLFVLGVAEIGSWRTSFAESNIFIVFGMILLWLGSGWLAVMFIRKGFGVSGWQGPAHVIHAAHDTQARLDGRAGGATLIASFISLSSGASLGQYGPIVQMGALCSSTLERLGMKPLLRPDVLIGCGVAAAISAGFHAPLAGILFSLEAILRHISIRAVPPIAISSVAAASVSGWLFDNTRLFAVSFPAPELLTEVPALLVAAPVFAASALMMLSLFFRTARYTPQQPFSLLSVLAIIGLAGLGTAMPSVLGVGSDVIMDMVVSELTLTIFASLLAAKLVAVMLSLYAGFSGGMLTPSLFIGAATGGITAQLLAQLGFEVTPALLVLAGMAAVSAPIIGAPFTAVILVLELTMSYEYAVGAMLAVVICSFLCSLIFGPGLFDKQLILRGIDVTKGRGSLILSSRMVGDLASDDYLVIDASLNASHAIRIMAEAGMSEAYCIGSDGRLTGKLALKDLIMAGEVQVASCLNETFLSFDDRTSLEQAITLASDFIGDAIPVTAHDTGVLLGVVSEADIFSAYLKITEQINQIEHG